MGTTITTLAVVAGIVYAMYKLAKHGSGHATDIVKQAGHATDIVKQAGRIVVNETKAVLNKLEDLEKSLTNALTDVRNDFERFKKNCASIFELEAKLSKELLEQKSIHDGVEKELSSLKSKYKEANEQQKPELEAAISFFLEKLERCKNKIVSLEKMLAEQKIQNAKVESDIRNYRSKIDGIEDKIVYVKNQYNIAKNKELLISSGGSSSGVYNLDEIFRNVNDYINRVDGTVRVHEVVEEETVKEEKFKEPGEQIDAQERLKRFLAE
jgi:phage shock protein A